MEKNYKKILLGMLGEKVVAKYLRDRGHEVNESLNVFDSAKDMVVDGENVEVKTQAPFIIHDSFSIATNQLTKIQNSHRVYWVCVPLSKTYDAYAGFIFEMDPKVAKHHTIRLKSGREMVCFKRNQPGMTIVHKIKDQKLFEHLKELSSSYL